MQYNSGEDKYTVSEGLDEISIDGWAAGVYKAENIFRKVEHDWKQAYLAREGIYYKHVIRNYTTPNQN